MLQTTDILIGTPQHTNSGNSWSVHSPLNVTQELPVVLVGLMVNRRFKNASLGVSRKLASCVSTTWTTFNECMNCEVQLQLNYDYWWKSCRKHIIRGKWEWKPVEITEFKLKSADNNACAINLKVTVLMTSLKVMLYQRSSLAGLNDANLVVHILYSYSHNFCHPDSIHCNFSKPD